MDLPGVDLDAFDDSAGEVAGDDPLLAGLTGPQREAVLHGRGPLLVLAAAGSGKTRVITRRIARLIRDGEPPWSILALTFTNKAAGEMRERVYAILGGEEGEPVDPRWTRGLTVSTFHSLCARLLRRYADREELPGVRADYSIYDTADQTSLMKKVIASANLSTSNWPPRSVLGVISNAKNELLDAEAYAARAGDFYTTQIARLYRAYEAGKRQAGAVDFDDLLLLTARLLAAAADVREELRLRYRHILIDEYQDTNRAQLQIARLLAGEDGGEAGGPNICVVGDPDQSIYGWRGADISNILEFEEHYPSARVVTLGENFRSTAPILAAADALIKRNARRKDKPLFTSRAGGERPVVTLCRDERHEAGLVADWFRRLREEGIGGERAAWKDMAVFYRTNALSRVMEDTLRSEDIPYVIARGTAFYQREEVKSAVAYLRVVANPADDVSLERVINTPARGIGKTSLDRVRLLAERDGVPLFHALRAAGSAQDLTQRSAAAIGRFLETVDGWTGAGSFLGEDVPGGLPELVERVIEESGLRGHYQRQAATSGAETDAERLDNLDELISSAREFEDQYDPAADPLADAAGLEEDEIEVPPLLAMLRAYLERISLVADADAADPEQGAVTLMTLHAAKGLEFPAVAMIGLEEGTLPHSRAAESEADLEEERRLAFVGITRAMRALWMTSARYRTIRGQTDRTVPSRFIAELAPDGDESLVTLSDQSDPLGGLPTRSRLGAAGHDVNAMTRGDLSDRLAALREQKSAGAAAASAQAAKKYPVGTRVRHPQFGEGKVAAIDGSGGSARLKIEFRGIGVKTLVFEYARLTRLGE